MKDIKNQKFGRLFVIDKSHKDKHGRWYWHCKCSCGKCLTIIGSSLRSGHTKSCGCLNRELSSQRAKISKTIHGDSIDKRMYKLHDTWRGMLYRCANPNSGSYARYGGRGIEVCNEW